MLTGIDRLMESGCERENKEKICRSRGGESCAFDGAMIVLQPIADAAHIVHGPIACCGNSWEGRGTLSSKGNMHRMGFTTDMSEMDIVYGSEDKLYQAILQTYEALKPKAIFVYATCVSGLIGEDIEAVCKKAEGFLNSKGDSARGMKSPLRVIPVNAPGFVGPKNLGNRIAGEVLLDYVIGAGSPLFTTDYDINLIGEYNIAGDLWLVEPIFKEAGIRVLSRITGDSTFEEITYAHKAKLNVVVCSRALINVAKEMERRYGIPYIEVSFFGRTEMSRALRLIASKLELQIKNSKFKNKVEEIINKKEKQIEERLKTYSHLKGKKAVLYTGGVKSWSFISALTDLGMEIVAVGTKKSTFEDEEKMKEILGENAPLVEDVTPKNLSRLIKERNADILVAGGRNQYLAIKEGYPFVDVNQERHTAYAGYEGLINLAEQISNSMRFYSNQQSAASNQQKKKAEGCKLKAESCLINPLKHSQSIGAAIAFQGIDRALPIIHGAQGCSFLAKVLLTKHFSEPIALASTKLFTEDVVMGSEENISNVVKGFIEKNNPAVIGILTSGLTEVKGDDIQLAVRRLQSKKPISPCHAELASASPNDGYFKTLKQVQGDINASYNRADKDCFIIPVSTPDYESGLEMGYAKAVQSVIESLVYSQNKKTIDYLLTTNDCLINVLAGSHLTPADFTELREIIESFGLRPIILPDLSALDGSREGFSALAIGGTKVDEIKMMGLSAFTVAIGASMEPAARILKERFDVEYEVLEGISGLRDTDVFMETLSLLSGKPIPQKYERQRRILIDGMRDAHFYFSNKKTCLALERDLSLQMSSCLNEMGAEIGIVDTNSGYLFSIQGDFDLLISNSHAEDTAKRLGVPLYQMGFPMYKVLGNNHRIAIGYRGTLMMINELANLLSEAYR